MIFYPQWYQDRLSLPEANYAGVVVGPDCFQGILGRFTDGKELQSMFARRNSAIIRMDVDLNRIGLQETCKIFAKLKADWNPSVKATVFVRLVRLKSG